MKIELNLNIVFSSVEPKVIKIIERDKSHRMECECKREYDEMKAIPNHNSQVLLFFWRTHALHRMTCVRQCRQNKVTIISHESKKKTVLLFLQLFRCCHKFHFFFCPRMIANEREKPSNKTMTPNTVTFWP